MASAVKYIKSNSCHSHSAVEDDVAVAEGVEHVKHVKPEVEAEIKV